MSDLKICIIGAGFSGLCSAIKIKENLGAYCKIFEKNEDVGGTWWSNKYPGCSCDIQSHLYSLSFEQNPNWSETYSRQPEILKYLQNVTKKHNLYKSIRFNTEVKSLTWNEDTNTWIVVVYDLVNKTEEKIFFDIVINATGVLRNPKIPKEFEAFKGTKLHTSYWDENVDLKGKVVGVVGTGATATQLITEIQKEAGELHVFQRTPPWVTPRTQINIPKIFQIFLVYVPFLLAIFRCVIYLSYEVTYLAFIMNSYFQIIGKKAHSYYRTFQLSERKDLIPKLEPKYEFGRKRIVFSSNFYKTLSEPNVILHTEKIKKVEENSIILSNGKTMKLDVLLLATGFNVQEFFAPIAIIGEGGVNVLDLWKKDRPLSYFGIMSKVLPNLFTLLGPNTVLGHNSVVFMMECQVTFILEVIKEMKVRKARRVSVKMSAEREFMKRIDAKLKETIWGNGASDAWYYNQNGVATTIWPFSTIRYWRDTKNVDFNDIEFKHIKLID